MYEDTKVLFYTGKWYVFDNFSAFAIEWGGRLWPTVEHAYQAAKFLDQEIVDSIHAARSPHDAKKIAHLPTNVLRVQRDWPEEKVVVMQHLLRLKVAQHDYVRRELLETGEKVIIEDSPVDSFWGRGPDWKGKNMSGILWMELREEVRRSS